MNYLLILYVLCWEIKHWKTWQQVGTIAMKDLLTNKNLQIYVTFQSFLRNSPVFVMFVFSCSTSLTYIGHWPELKRKKKCFITEANDSFWHLCSIHFFPAVLNFRIQFYHYNKNLVGFSIHVPHYINFLQESGTISRCHCPVDLFRISNLATLLQELILYIVGWYVNFGNIVFLRFFSSIFGPGMT